MINKKSDLRRVDLDVAFEMATKMQTLTSKCQAAQLTCTCSRVAEINEHIQPFTEPKKLPLLENRHTR